MRIVSINSVNFGSTGNIMLGIAKEAENAGHETLVCYLKSRENERKTVENKLLIGSRFSRNLHRVLAKWTGFEGCFSLFSTWRFLRKLDAWNPDVLHLHNLHSWYIHLGLLFRWIKKRNIKVVWTLHDCWSLTGHCPYFDIVKCDKWKTGCHHCSQYKKYPDSKIDNARYMYYFKKKWFAGVKDMTLITPSNWLAGLVKKSFLNEYPIKVIHNGIDLTVFQPIESNLREELKLQDKFVILGCADSWGERKGLDVVIELSQRLGDGYQVVLVGTNAEIDKELPSEIISVHRTRNQEELAKYYTMADVFANPTREEVLGLVNIEALACGTPVVTFASGGSPECVDKSCGIVVPCDDADAMEKEIRYVCEGKVFTQDACRKRAEMFDKNDKFQECVMLYE